MADTPIHYLLVSLWGFPKVQLSQPVSAAAGFFPFFPQKSFITKEMVLICSMRFRTILLRLPALFIAGSIWFLSSQSTLPQPKGILGWDKLQHLLAYLVLSVTVGLWISPAFWERRSVFAVLLTMLISSAYGVIDEFHQYFVPGRDCNVWDWLADTLGALLGALVIMVLMKKWRRKETGSL
jgi:VanZ family protein